MTVQTLTRVFLRGTNRLADPDLSLTPDQVREYYTDLFPELLNADVSEGEVKGADLVYEFQKPAVKNKG